MKSKIYLDVFVDIHLTFHPHIDKIVALAFIRSNLILKCFASCDISTLIRAFTVNVCPILEYASCVWSHIRWGKSNKFHLFKEVSPDGCYIIHVLIVKRDYYASA